MVRNYVHIKDNIAKLRTFTRPLYGITGNYGSCLLWGKLGLYRHHCDQPPIPYSRVIICTLKVKHRPLANGCNDSFITTSISNYVNIIKLHH